MIENVYLIDDDEISIFLTEFMLEGFSKSLKCFSSAETALNEIIATEQNSSMPFVIFLDLNMPLMDGWAFLEAMKQWQHKFRERCKVVILTSSIDKAEIRRSTQYKHVIKFVSKPLDDKNLDFVKSILRKN